MTETPNVAVQFGSRTGRYLRLANPVIAASGTFGYGEELAPLLDIQMLGAVVCKGTTLEPRRGNSQPRLAETPDGMLNAIGLQNIGVDMVIREKAPVWAKWQVPVIVNIAADSVADYAELAYRLDSVPGISGLEVNVSCPNVAAGCLEFGTDARTAAQVTAAVRQATTLPVIVKLTPNVTDIVSIAVAVAAAGADAISLINTLRGMAIDINKRKPLLGNITGGLSGPALKPVALAMVYAVARAVEIPVIGGGGISTAEDALEFIMAGATAVEVGTATFLNPKATLHIIDGLVEYLRREGIGDVTQLIGCAWH
jgi:dihydroorotate dehydrogenase (NAD+) catalytic subunit